MRVRIISKPPPKYGVDKDSLFVGRIYNLASSLASALMLDGYAELYDTLTAEEKRERLEEATHTAWTASDRTRRWPVSRGRKKE